MARLFISYVHDDSSFVRRLARRLSMEGYDAWYYDRDAIAGMPYTGVIPDAISSAAAFIVVISAATARSSQVTSEIILAHESGKARFPLLLDLTHDEFRRLRRDWEMPLAGATTLTVRNGRLAEIIPKLIKGLQNAGVVPEARTMAVAQPIVRVFREDGQPRQSVRLGGEGLTLGRDRESDIWLEDPKISRHHLRLDWDGRWATVTDLGSSNGTRLDEMHLLRNTPRRWRPDQVLRVPDHVLRLDLAGSGH